MPNVESLEVYYCPHEGTEFYIANNEEQEDVLFCPFCGGCIEDEDKEYEAIEEYMYEEDEDDD